MNFQLAISFSFSILIAGIVGIIRFSRIGKVYHPFVFLIWLGCLNEITSYLFIINGKYNIVNGIIYDLAESILLLLFLKNLGVFKRRSYLFFTLIFLFTGIWVIESFFQHKFGEDFNSYFTISYSFSLVLLSINAINNLLFKERDLVKNPAFLICIGIVIFFTYRVVVEIFWLYGFKASVNFRMNVYIILIYINFLCNLIYALAILWMQKKQPFTLQF